MFTVDTITPADVLNTITKAHGVLARTDEINALSNGSSDVRYRTLTQHLAVVTEFLTAHYEATQVDHLGRALDTPIDIDGLGDAIDSLDYLTEEA